MDEGGERDPLILHTDDRGGDDQGNETTGFDPGDPVASSTPPLRRHTTMKSPRAQTSYSELPNTPGLSITYYAESKLIKEFPDFNRMEIKSRIDDKGRLEVGLIAPKNVIIV